MNLALDILNDDCLYCICQHLNPKDILSLYNAMYQYMPTIIVRKCLKQVEKVSKVCDNCCVVTVNIPSGPTNHKTIHEIRSDPGHLYAIGLHKNPDTVGDFFTPISLDSSIKNITNNYEIKSIENYISCSRKENNVRTPTGNFVMAYNNKDGNPKKLGIIFHMFDLV